MVYSWYMNCSSCDSPFDPDSPDQDLCYSCMMMPESLYNPDKANEGTHGYLNRASKDPELGRAFTGLLTGAHYKGSRKHSSPNYKPKACNKCGKSFKPKHGSDILCISCKPPKDPSVKIRANVRSRMNVLYKLWLQDAGFYTKDSIKIKNPPYLLRNPVKMFSVNSD